jgi:glycosyltransferase involved in cell wall biosynthesis
MATSCDRRLCVLFHESEILGAGLSIVRVLDALRSSGWRVGGWFPGPGSLVDEAGPALAARGFFEKPIAFSLGGWRREPGIMPRLLRTPPYLSAFARWLAAEAPDVVHANSLLMLPEATIARARGVPVVLQVHELPRPGPKRAVSIRWAARVADVLVGVSAPVSSMLREHAGRTPVLTVHNGVPVTPPAEPAHDGFVVGTIGHVARTKGTDVFLEAARLARAARPALRFEHVGPTRLWGDDEYDDRVEALAASPELRDSLRMLGHRPAAAALARWSVFVLASRQEAFPLSTLEAMEAGVPVVATSVGGVPEQIEHLESGVLVAPESASQISDWIVRLYDDQELRSRLGAAGRKRVREAFPLEAQAHGLEHAYDEAISRRRRRRRAGGIGLSGRSRLL